MIESFTTFLRRAFIDVHTRVFGSRVVLSDQVSDVLCVNDDDTKNNAFVLYDQDTEGGEAFAEITPLDQPLVVEVGTETVMISYLYTIYIKEAWPEYQERVKSLVYGASEETPLLIFLARIYGAIWHEIRHQVQDSFLPQDRWKKNLDFVSRDPIVSGIDTPALIMRYEEVVKEQRDTYALFYQDREQLAKLLDAETDAMCTEVAGTFEWLRMSLAGLPHDEKVSRIAELIRS